MMFETTYSDDLRQRTNPESEVLILKNGVMG